MFYCYSIACVFFLLFFRVYILLFISSLSFRPLLSVASLFRWLWCSTINHVIKLIQFSFEFRKISLSIFCYRWLDKIAWQFLKIVFSIFSFVLKSVRRERDRENISHRITYHFTSFLTSMEKQFSKAKSKSDRESSKRQRVRIMIKNKTTTTTKTVCEMTVCDGNVLSTTT